MKIRCKLYTFFLIIVPFFLLAEENTDSTVSNPHGSVHIFKSLEKLEIDGKIDEPVWQTATRKTLDYEIQPGDLTTPPVKTEVLLTYDETNLYLAFKCEDDPKLIRATLQDRDKIWADDFIGIELDTYGDANWGYFIFANPYGIQGDLRISNNSHRPEVTFDLLYESRGIITNEGYQVEMSIPFSSLRFPDRTEHTWRVNFFRNHPRNSQRQYSWVPINRDDPCEMCQYGELTGLTNIRSGNPLELLPSVTAAKTGYIEDDDDVNSAFINEKIKGEPGISVRWSATPSLMFEATLNPDFSQIESDALQVDVNTTFALRFPERRPFFMEGSHMFRTRTNIVYTRSINDPIIAGKILGRWDQNSVAYLGAIDENTPLILPFEEKSEFVKMGKSVTNIARYKNSFGESSFFGAILTDRRLQANGSGTNFGIDGIWWLNGNLAIDWEAIGSYTKEPNDTSLTTDINHEKFSRDSLTAGFDGESYWGDAVNIGIEWKDRNLNIDLSYGQTSPTFRADNGFVRSNNRRRVFLRSRYTIYTNSWYLDRFSPKLMAGLFYNYDGKLKDIWIEPGISFVFKAQTNIQIEYAFNSENFSGIQFDHMDRLRISLESNFSDPFSILMFLQTGKSIARDELVPGKGVDLDLTATIKPMQALIIEPSVAYSYLNRVDNGESIFDGYILRARINYQFTRELFLRLIGQYDSFNDYFGFEPLLSYKINAFSIFYIGSKHDYIKFEHPYSWTPATRQYFLKFQYLFRI